MPTSDPETADARWVRRDLTGSLADAWEHVAEQWVTWVRTPGHDSYDKFHRDSFRRLLPEPKGPCLDVGCGEGRLPRDMKSWGYDVVGVDASPTLIRYAREADRDGKYFVASGSSLPFGDESFALVTAFMSLHDMDDAPSAAGQIARVVAPGGRVCIAVVHPMSSAGHFESRDTDARFVIDGSYLTARKYADSAERAGLPMTFSSHHRPLHAYFDMLTGAGLLIEHVAEVPDPTAEPESRWRRLPLFLQIRARKP